MRNSILIPLAAVLLLPAGCTSRHPTVLSGENAYEMQSSIMTLSADLPPGKRDEFEHAIATIVFQANDRSLQNGDRLTPQSIRMLRGRSVNQVIESAKLIRTVASY